MNEPIWISKQVVLAIHQLQLEEHGGLSGIRSESGLEAALAGPQQTYTYVPDVNLVQLAAAYAWKIARAHVLVDGNKRTAWVICVGFLRRNGLNVLPDKPEYVEVMRSVAEGSITENDFAAWLERQVVRSQEEEERNL